METNKRIERFSRMMAKTLAKMRKEGMKAEADEMQKAAQATVERMRKGCDR